MPTLFKDLAIDDTFAATPKHRYAKLGARTYRKAESNMALCAEDGVQYYFPSETEVLSIEEYEAILDAECVMDEAEDREARAHFRTISKR